MHYSQELYLELLDTILVNNAYSESTFGLTFSGSTDNVMEASSDLTNLLASVSNRLNIKVKRGTILTSDGFDYYIDVKSLLNRVPKHINCIGAEMECFGLFHVANILNKQAACLLSVVDSHTKKTLVSPKNRETALKNMIEIALESVIE